MRPILVTLLALLFSFACRPATKSPVLAPDQVFSSSVSDVSSAADFSGKQARMLDLRTNVTSADLAGGGRR